MGGMRRIIAEILNGIAAQGLKGGFRVDENGKLIEDYADAWQDEQGNPLCNYIGDEEGTEERYCGTEPEKCEDAVSAGYIRDTAQRGGS